MTPMTRTFALFALFAAEPPELHRHANRKRCAAASALNSDRTLVLFDDLSGDAKSETGTLLTFGGEERFENERQIGSDDSCSRVGDHNLNLVFRQSSGN